MEMCGMADSSRKTPPRTVEQSSCVDWKSSVKPEKCRKWRADTRRGSVEQIRVGALWANSCLGEWQRPVRLVAEVVANVRVDVSLEYGQRLGIVLKQHFLGLYGRRGRKTIDGDR